MRSSLVASVLLVVTACATPSPERLQAIAMPSRTAICVPCVEPCTPDSSCNEAPAAVVPAAVTKPAPVVAAAPAPKPEPKPAAAPTFSPEPGSYTATQRVTLSSSTPGAVIHYTTDDSAPTESSPVYSGPITVDKNTTVKAIAVAPDAPASKAASGDYAVTRPETPRVAVKADKLELKETVYFDTSKATIKPASFSLLDEVATALKSHDVKHANIDGHTDSSGDAAFNKQLSQQRAEAVREYLVGKGVEAARLDAKGYGAEKPVAPNTTKKGREQNRRVEFNIEN
jgi:outer membrane protein OmpA-like peptidoglycan-associated protein